jgi:hypothetical protein
MESVLLPWTIASTILLFVAAYWVYTLERRFNDLEERYTRLLAMTEESEAPTIAGLLHRLEDQEERLKGAEAYLAELARVLPHTVQGYGVVRYNAFANAGGEQSFSLALVDAKGSGVVVSGLHGREMRVYAKPLTQWRAAHSLSSEEQEALGLAREMVEH